MPFRAEEVQKCLSDLLCGHVFLAFEGAKIAVSLQFWKALYLYLFQLREMLNIPKDEEFPNLFVHICNSVKPDPTHEQDKQSSDYPICYIHSTPFTLQCMLFGMNWFSLFGEYMGQGFVN